MNVSEAIAQTIVREGVGIAFSLLGDTNMETVIRLADLGLPVHEARHEGAAMAMAEGWARVTGRVALCSVTAGAGFAHTILPLISATRRSPCPVVILTGHPSRDHGDLENFEAFDHQGMARLAGAQYQPIASPGVAVDSIRSAIHRAASSGRPVVVDIPLDVQSAEYPWELQDSRSIDLGFARQILRPDPQALHQAADMLVSSKRPVILAGAGANSIDARDDLIMLGEACGALLATTSAARGLFHGEPYNAGVCGLFSSSIATEFFGEADCVVAFGASLNANTLAGGYLFPNARFVQVDNRAPHAMQTGDLADCYVQGDVSAVASALRLAVANKVDESKFRTSDIEWALRDDVIDSASFDIAAGEVDPRALSELLDHLLPDECGFVSSSAHFWAFTQMHMRKWRRPNVYASHSGAIGYTVSVALGAALGTGLPVVAVDGDAGFLMNCHVLDTVARSHAKLLTVIFNDRALGAEYHKLRAWDLNAELAVTPTIDLAHVAESFGVRSATLTDLGQLAGYIDEFINGDGPFLIDARVSRNVVSQPFRRSYFGQS